MLTKILRNKTVVRVSLWLACVNLLWWGFGGCIVSRPFDAQVWQQSPPKRWAGHQRAAMYDDLVWNRLRSGMTRAQVVALLGWPDRIKGQTFGYKWGFSLGYTRYIVITLGREGRVVSWRGSY